MAGEKSTQKIEDVILFQIEQTNKAAKGYTQREFDALGIRITVDQWVLLKIVSEKAPLSQKELAGFSHRDPASITRTIDLLEKKGLMMRQSIEGNRRTYHIDLTTKGRKFVQERMPMIEEHRRNSVKGLSESELVNLSRMLTQIRKNME